MFVTGYAVDEFLAGWKASGRLTCRRSHWRKSFINADYQTFRQPKPPTTFQTNQTGSTSD